jgi:putative Holliday junction resolvase
MAIDYGQKRTGIAVTDELRLFATGLTTVPSASVITFLKKYFDQQSVDVVVVGLPRQLNNTPSDAQRFTEPFVKQLRKHFPDVTVERFDERFTSRMAQDTLLQAGLKKKDRQNKQLVDTVSATLILQSYMHMLSSQNQHYLS